LISSRFGFAFEASSAVAAMICPEVQMPHWKPPLRMNASCSAVS
jgi:hypothetical protein